MKRLLPLLLLLLALTGCARQTGDITLPGANTATPVFSAQEILQLKEEAVRPYVLLDNAIREDDCLYRIDCEATDRGQYSRMLPFNDNLLLYEQLWNRGGSSQLQLALMDLKNGKLLAEAALDIQGFVHPQVVNDQLFICDSQMGIIYHLDAGLQLVDEITVTPDWNHWYLSPDGDLLYQIGFLEPVRVTNLTDGTYEIPDLPISDISLSDSDFNQLTLNYLDVETQMNTTGYLDLTDGTVTAAPFDAPLSSVQHWGDIWLGADMMEGGIYYLGNDAAPQVIQVDDNTTLQLLSPTGHLVKRTDGRSLSLYTQDGTFLSTCQPGWDEDVYLDNNFIWSEEYGGYFVTSVHPQDGFELVFWAVEPSGEGSNLEMTAWEDYRTPSAGTAVDAQLYERAAQMSEEYGVVILIADQCDTVFNNFESEQLLEEYWIDYALDNLETALSSYPEGFFDQLRFDQVRYVEIQLVGNLIATDDEWKTASYSAFASQYTGHYLVVMDSYQASVNTYYHEFSHIIDRKLDWDAYCRDNALYSEEQWRALSPDFADYSFTYTDWPDIGADNLTDYFVDSYSRTYPTEDRARIMEYAMMDWLFDLENSPGIREKLDYYCRCIRDSFDTTGWPEVTVWEAPLNAQ